MVVAHVCTPVNSGLATICYICVAEDDDYEDKLKYAIAKILKREGEKFNCALKTVYVKYLKSVPFVLI